MPSLRCPRCATVVTVPEGTAPLCPNCGYRDGQGQSAASAGPAMPPPGFAAPQGYGAPPGYPPPGMMPPGYPPGGVPPGYAPPGYPGYGYAMPPKAPGESVTALVLGIVAMCLGWIPFVGWTLGIILGILAVVMGSLGIRKANLDPANVGGKGMAIAGLVLGIIGGLAGLFFLLAIMGSLGAAFS